MLNIFCGEFGAIYLNCSILTFTGTANMQACIWGNQRILWTMECRYASKVRYLMHEGKKYCYSSKSKSPNKTQISLPKYCLILYKCIYLSLSIDFEAGCSITTWNLMTWKSAYFYVKIKPRIKLKMEMRDTLLDINNVLSYSESYSKQTKFCIQTSLLLNAYKMYKYVML